MKSRFEELPETFLVGKSVEMSMLNNLTHQLWKSFMPRRNEVKHQSTTDFISLQLYPEEFMSKGINPNKSFTKWAGVFVESIEDVPNDMGSLIIPGGLYVVFDYVGSGNDAPHAFQYIFTEWLPKSTYRLDNRPHFEVLGEKYKNNDPNSEEEIWIPIALK